MSHHLNCIRHISSQSQSHAFRISETAISLPLRNTDHAALSTDPASRYTNRSASRPCPASPTPSNPQRTCTCMHPFVPGAISSHLDSLCLHCLGLHDPLIPSCAILCLLGPILGVLDSILKPTANGDFSPIPLCLG
jgi:hypothetical protein